MTSRNAAPHEHAVTFLARADRFTSVVDAGPAADHGWDSPSPCAGWSAAEVLDHVVDAERDFLAQRGAGVGDRPAGDPREIWHTHRQLLRRLLADGEFVAGAYEGFFGPTTVGESLVRFYGFDLLVHGWDLARAFGRDLTLTPAEVAVLDAEADGFGPALYADGVCAAALDPPADAGPQQRLLARLGQLA